MTISHKLGVQEIGTVSALEFGKNAQFNQFQ
jgi:hypothetical protein